MTEARHTHLTPQERAARGVAARTLVPLEGHAEFTPAADRTDPVTVSPVPGVPAARPAR